MAILKQVITLTANQYDIIKNGGAISVDDKIYTYDENALYMVPEENPDIKCDTLEGWNNKVNFIPEQGQIIIYTDKTTVVDEEGKTIKYPGIKIGDGNAYLIDLPFIGDDNVELLLDHINNRTVHITQEERIFWNNKLNCENHINDQTLILNRN